MLTCVLLSAGESRRFGSPKALATISGQPAIVRLQQSLLEANIDEIIVVLGTHAQAIKPHVFNHTKVRIVHNKDYKLGQTSSFQAGVSVVNAQSTGIMLLPVDCPLVSASTIKALTREFGKMSPAILVPSCGGKRGHPPVFNTMLKPDILTLSPHEGVNVLFSRFTVMELPTEDKGILRTFNTPQEYGKLFQD